MGNKYGSTGDERIASDYAQRNNETQDLLKQFLSGVQAKQAQQTSGQQALEQAQFKDKLGQAGADRNVATLEGLLTKHPGMGGSVGENGNVSLSKPASTGVAEARLAAMHDRQVDNKSEGLSKRYEKSQGFQSALQEIEANTNRDGKGGVVTNPGAKLMSAGKFLSGAPAQAIGIGEMLGAVPKGATAERKGLERLQLEYQKAMGGMRQTDEMRRAERAAMGMMASGDPDLVSKGVRSLAKNVRNGLHTIQSGYSPEVLDRVHSTLGNPAEAFGTVYDDNAHPAAAPQQGAMDAPQQQAPAPQGAAPGGLDAKLKRLEYLRSIK